MSGAMSGGPGISRFARKNLVQLDAHQFRHHGPLLPGIAPDGDRMQVLKGVEVAFVHRLLFVKINLADEIAVIAADNIRIVFGHSKNHIWWRISLLGFSYPSALRWST